MAVDTASSKFICKLTIPVSLAQYLLNSRKILRTTEKCCMVSSGYFLISIHNFLLPRGLHKHIPGYTL